MEHTTPLLGLSLCSVNEAGKRLIPRTQSIFAYTVPGSRYHTAAPGLDLRLHLADDPFPRPCPSHLHPGTQHTRPGLSTVRIQTQVQVQVQGQTQAQVQVQSQDPEALRGSLCWVPGRAAG